MTSRNRRDALTNWAMKPLTLGAGHLWVPMSRPWEMNVRLCMNFFHINLQILKSSKLWSSWVGTQLMQLRVKAWKSQDFNARKRIQSPLKSWVFRVYTRNCLNFVHNWDDHSLLYICVLPQRLVCPFSHSLTSVKRLIVLNYNLFYTSYHNN